MLRRMICFGMLLVVWWGSMLTPTPALAAPTPDTPIDVVVMIDNSGSMHSAVRQNKVAAADWGKGADPHGLRYAATTMLLDVLDPSDRLGVVHFSDTARILGTPATMTRMDDTSRTALRRDIDAVTIDYATPPPGRNNRYGVINDPAIPPGQTAYLPAFATTQQLLRDTKSTNAQAVILLTDGAPTDMGATAAITDTMQQQLQTLGVPVFLLMLTDPANTAPEDVRAVKAAFTNSNQRVIEIASAQDIAFAVASVLTYLKPSLYLDTLQGTPATGRDASVFVARSSAAQRISDMTFVFASARATANLEVQSSAAGLINGTGTRFHTFRTPSGTDIAGEWTFTANAPPADITSFVFMRAAVRMTLRYPDMRATSGQVLAYPRNAAHVVGALIDGVAPSTLAQMTITTATRCDAVQPDTDTTPYTTRTSGLDATTQPLVWALLPATTQPLAVLVTLRPTNQVALRRCYQFQPTAMELPLRMTTPVSDTPDMPNGELAVAVALPTHSAVKYAGAALFDTPANGRTNPPARMTLTRDSASARLRPTQAGAYTLDVLVSAQVQARPLVLYATRALTPQQACALTRVGGSDERDIGILTSAADIDLSLTCLTKGDGNPQPIQLGKDALVDAQNTPVPAALRTKLFAVGALQQQDGRVTWPITLKNVVLLDAGTYTVRITVPIYGKQLAVQYTLTRPVDTIALTWSGARATQAVLDVGTFGPGENTRSVCVTPQITALVPEPRMATDAVVTALRHDNVAVDGSTLAVTTRWNDPACPNAYAVQVVIADTLDAATYQADVRFRANDPHIRVTPDPVRVQFTTAPLRVQLAFAQPVAGTTLPTYLMPVLPSRNPFAHTTVSVPYTATLSGAVAMPMLTQPRATAALDGEAQLAVSAYWDSVPAQQYAPNGYAGALIIADVPRYTWNGGVYDVTVTMDDVQIESAHTLVFRVYTSSYLTLVLALMISLGASIAITLGIRRFRQARSPEPPSPYVPPPC